MWNFIFRPDNFIFLSRIAQFPSDFPLPGSVRVDKATGFCCYRKCLALDVRRNVKRLNLITQRPPPIDDGISSLARLSARLFYMHQMNVVKHDK